MPASSSYTELPNIFIVFLLKPHTVLTLLNLQSTVTGDNSYDAVLQGYDCSGDFSTSEGNTLNKPYLRNCLGV